MLSAMICSKLEVNCLQRGGFCSGCILPAIKKAPRVGGAFEVLILRGAIPF